MIRGFRSRKSPVGCASQFTENNTKPFTATTVGGCYRQEIQTAAHEGKHAAAELRAGKNAHLRYCSKIRSSYTTIVMKDMPLKQEMPAFFARPEIVKLRNRLTVRSTKPRKMRHDRVAGCNSGSHLATEPVSQTNQ